jgi:hypothetical protein
MKYLLIISLFLSASLNAMCGCCLTADLLTYDVEADAQSSGCCGSVETEPLQPASCSGNCETMACAQSLADLEPLHYQNSLSLLTLSAPVAVHTGLLAEATNPYQLSPAANSLAAPATLPLRHRLCVYRL